MGGRKTRRAFERVMGMESSGVLSGGSAGDIGGRHGNGVLEMGGNQRILETTIEAIDIAHITSNAMEDLEVVAEKFLCPTSDLVNGAVVLKDFTHGAAIADPRQFSAPEELAILTDTPTATGGFTNKGMKMLFTLSAFARAKTNGKEAGATHGDVKMADTSGVKSMKGSNRSRGVVGLHKDPAHTKGGPIGFQEAGF